MATIDPDPRGAIAAIVAELAAGTWWDGHKAHKQIAQQFNVGLHTVPALHSAAVKQWRKDLAAMARAPDAEQPAPQQGTARGPLCGWPVAPGHPELRSAQDPDDRRWD